jgi:hypothetical protein
MSTLRRTKTTPFGIFLRAPSVGAGSILQKEGYVFVKADLTLNKVDPTLK